MYKKNLTTSTTTTVNHTVR